MSSRISRLPFEVKVTLFVFLAFFALFTAFISYYTVDEGEEGVVLRYGKVIKTSSPGLHFKVPFMDSVEKISTRTQTVSLDKVAVYSKDQQPADVAISVTFSVPNGMSQDVYAHFGSIENAFQRIIQPNALQEFKNVFGKFTASSAVQDRTRLTNDSFNAIKEALKGYPYLNVTGIQIENIDFSDAYEATIENRMKSEVEVQRAQQELEKEKIQASIKLTQAEADAKSHILQAEAEAKALNIKGDALRKNPEIIELTKAEKWNGQLPQVTGGSVPMINLQK